MVSLRSTSVLAGIGCPRPIIYRQEMKSRFHVWQAVTGTALAALRNKGEGVLSLCLQEIAEDKIGRAWVEKIVCGETEEA